MTYLSVVIGRCPLYSHYWGIRRHPSNAGCSNFGYTKIKATPLLGSMKGKKID